MERASTLRSKVVSLVLSTCAPGKDVESLDRGKIHFSTPQEGQ
jgi:hypothetical protein